MNKLWPICLLAVAWSVGPAIPAWLDGALLGHGQTDLYPSVWGMWAFSKAQPGLPGHTPLLGFPEGMGFYYSSPLKGWLATLLLPWCDLVTTWNLLVVGARLATVLTTFAAARAWGFSTRGALAAAAVYGCSPFFQGYAVEGIAEGTDGWTLALWAWSIGAKRFRFSAIALALTLVSSWYLGMVGLLLTVLAMTHDRRAAWGLLGVFLAAPALVQFMGAFPGTSPLDPAVRAAMGASLAIPSPGWHDGLQPFAMNTYTGFIVLAAALSSRTRWTAVAAVPAFLSMGIGPLYDLPVAELVRFPYRWHAATLMLLAPAVAIAAERWRWGMLLPPLIVLEGLLLSPIEPIIPGASADIPPYVDAIDGPVLEIPGPVAMPPGIVNPSRARARYLLYHQTQHGQPSPWVPDFNSVGVGSSDGAQLLRALDGLDPLTGAPVSAEPPWQALAERGVYQVVIHPLLIGERRSAAAAQSLEAQGWTRTFSGPDAVIYTVTGR